MSREPQGQNSQDVIASRRYLANTSGSATGASFECGFIFIDNTAVLIGVSTPLDLTLASSLIRLDLSKPSRVAPIVKGALEDMLCTLKSRNFSVRVIMSDGEGAISKIVPHLRALGIEVDISAAGGHVARIERRIQMVKERARAHICGRIPFTLTDLGNTMLVLYCV